MTPEEEILENVAHEHIKDNRKIVLSTFADDKHKPSLNPVALFMAGSPGAGKTEVSQSLIQRFKDEPIRIDADDIRPLCPGYTGPNAYVFQKAANKGVNILFDHALHNKINCILDGTFAYAAAEQNIARALKHGFIVQLWFVYQAPMLAWEFTKVRESRQNRHVPKEAFVNAFFRARENVRAVKARFGAQVRVNLLIKNYVQNTEEFYLNITPAELDRLTDCGYSEDELMQILV